MEPQWELPKSGPKGDQSLTVDEQQFYGAYFGNRLPSGNTFIDDTRCMPKSARTLWKTIVQLPAISDKVEHPYGVAQLLIILNGDRYFLESHEGVSPFGAWLRDGETPIDSIRRQALREMDGFDVPEIEFTKEGEGPATLYIGSLVLDSLPKTTHSWKWVLSPRDYIERINSQHHLIHLRNLTLYGGSPIAEDIGDITVIHDDPRKATHKPSMYDAHITDILRTKVSKPFHTYEIDSQGVRRFIQYKKYPTSDRSKSNNCIIIDPKGYQIDGGKLNIVLAASGSGKTHFGAPFVDGDTLLKWPPNLDWLKSPESIHAVNIGLWQQLSEAPKDDIIMYAGDMSAIPSYLVGKFNFIALVHVNESVMHRNLEERKRKKANQPTDWDLINDHREKLLVWAHRNEVPVFSTFTEVRDRIVRNTRVKMDDSLNRGFNRMNITKTALKLVAPTGVYTHLHSSGGMTFGSHVSMRIHTNEYARYTGLTQHRWKHVTRTLPLFYIMSMLGYKVTTELTPCGHISDIVYKGNTISASGHMLGMFTWLAFPDSRLAGMPSLYPDMHTYLVMYMRNQYEITPSLEPYAKTVSYHRWVETYAGIVGSYYAIKLLLIKGVPMRKRDAIMWYLYARRAVRMIMITDRTSFMDVVYNRDDDSRFGHIIV